MINTSADILIVGSGVAGALLAYELTKKNLKVTVLEAEPRVNRAEATVRFQNASIKTPESPYLLSTFSPHPLADQPASFYIQKGPDIFNATFQNQRNLGVATFCTNPLFGAGGETKVSTKKSPTCIHSRLASG